MSTNILPSTTQTSTKTPRHHSVGNALEQDSNDTTRRRSSLLNDMKKNHSGVLYLKSKKTFSAKWCVLTNVDFSYFNDKCSLAIPKEQISLYSLLSLTRHPYVELDEDGASNYYTFDIAYSVSSSGKSGYIKSAKYITRTFGAQSIQDRDTWIDKITQSLSRKLASFTMTNYTENSRYILKIIYKNVQTNDYFLDIIEVI